MFELLCTMYGVLCAILMTDGWWFW